MVWEYVSDNPRKFTHWPSPFSNMVKRIDVLACEDHWQARVEMWSIAAAEFFFSNFIPSPVELTRKFVLGSYKCGFYIPLKVKSPLDIIWKDGRTSTYFLELARPITTALFYFWAASTIIEAMQTYTSLIYKDEFCDLAGNECLLRDGHGTFPTGADADRSGSPALFQVIYDPENRYNGGGGVIVSGARRVTATAFGYIQSSVSTITNIRLYIRFGGDNYNEVTIPDLLPGEQGLWNVSWSGHIVGEVFSVFFRCHVSGALGPANTIYCTRFTVTAAEDIPDPKEPYIWENTPKSNLCHDLYEALYGES